MNQFNFNPPLPPPALPRKPRVLVACEFSGVVRDAFIGAGYNAVSCDFLPTESPGPHIEGDVLEHLDDGWSMMVAFPPCTHLSASGARWWRDKQHAQALALMFVRILMNAAIPRIAIENPVGRISSAIRKPDQIIQPWQFGHGEVKTTCLWLNGLPRLEPTKIVEAREQKCWKQPFHKDRWKRRSRTYEGIAKAMAEQWGRYAG